MADIRGPRLPVQTAAVEGGTRSWGRGHSPRCPRGPAGGWAPAGGGHVVRGTFRHAVEVWEGALGVLPGSSGVLPGTGRPLPRRTWYVSSRRRGVGGDTRRVARVVWRVAGHRSAVATSYLVRFFTPSECGRGHSTCCPGRLACCRAHPGCCRIVVGRFPCRPGNYPRPSCTL